MEQRVVDGAAGLWMFESIDEIAGYVQRMYARFQSGHPAELISHLPPLLRNPAALMERAVELAGPDGLPRQELIATFGRCGRERRDNGIREMTASGHVVQVTETRPNRAGRQQAQIVFRWVPPDES